MLPHQRNGIRVQGLESSMQCSLFLNISSGSVSNICLDYILKELTAETCALGVSMELTCSVNVYQTIWIHHRGAFTLKKGWILEAAGILHSNHGKFCNSMFYVIKCN